MPKVWDFTLYKLGCQ